MQHIHLRSLNCSLREFYDTFYVTIAVIHYHSTGFSGDIFAVSYDKGRFPTKAYQDQHCSSHSINKGVRKGSVHNSLPNQDLNNMDDIREKYNSGEAHAREAFEELCAMVDALAVSIYKIVKIFWHRNWI